MLLHLHLFLFKCIIQFWVKSDDSEAVVRYYCIWQHWLWLSLTSSSVSSLQQLSAFWKMMPQLAAIQSKVPLYPADRIQNCKQAVILAPQMFTNSGSCKVAVPNCRHFTFILKCRKPDGFRLLSKWVQLPMISNIFGDKQAGSLSECQKVRKQRELGNKWEEMNWLMSQMESRAFKGEDMKGENGTNRRWH